MQGPHASSSPSGPRGRDAFTLVELIVTIGIVAVLATLTALALAGDQGQGRLNQASIQTLALLEQARARSIQDRTHVALVFFPSPVDAPGTQARAALFSLTTSRSSVDGHWTLATARLGEWQKLPQGISLSPDPSIEGGTNLLTIPDPGRALSLPGGTLLTPSFESPDNQPPAPAPFIAFAPSGAAVAPPSPTDLTLVTPRSSQPAVIRVYPSSGRSRILQ